MIKTSIDHGEIIVNSVFIIKDYGDCLLVEIDLLSKYAEASMTVVDHEGNLSVVFSPTEDTLHIDETKKEKDTWVNFEMDNGWSFFSVGQPQRYTCRVVLVKENIYDT